MNQEQLEKFDYHRVNHAPWTRGNNLDKKNPRKYDVTFYLFRGDIIIKKNIDAEQLEQIENMICLKGYLYFLKSDEGISINRNNIQRYEYVWLNPHWVDCNFCKARTIVEWFSKKKEEK